ncbi:M48 family metalloprotease [Parasphingorhabdus sp. DH2-15]|uniref:M48 family metalloprotease n=1 Tax=Parasphingorhabdus sp. DH2-15 TaxID=3444112 RepID=UPI003F6839D6
MVSGKMFLRTTLLASAVITCVSSIATAPVAALPLQKDEVRSISDEEKAQGEAVHPQLLQQFGGPYTGSQAAYVERIGKDIAVQSGLGNAREDFTVTLLDSSVNNAFAIPGGYVYVTRQLMALMNDEAELAGVLGHEVGHVAARHSEKRQKKARRNSLFGAIGQIGAGLLLGNSGFGRLGQQVFGTGSQLLTLRYSRKQEYEADDLGVQYLRSAGYDPRAVSSMLYSLALQNALDARASGKQTSSVPTWASTHPNPAKRVSRAAKKAGDSTGTRNKTRFLNQLDNMAYGQDSAQGVVQGSRFIHPELDFVFDAPSGYSISNGSSAVSINGQGGQSQLTLRTYNNDLGAYMRSIFAEVSKEQNIAFGEISRTTINGLPAAFSTARVGSGRDIRDITVFAYEFSPSRALHFVTLTAAGRSGNFTSMFRSMRRLADNEAVGIKNRKVKIVTVQSGDTVATLSAKMAFDSLQEERFRTLNGLSASDSLTAGQRIKMVSY